MTLVLSQEVYMRHKVTPWISVILVLILNGCSTIESGEDLTELNRQGRWDEVRSAGVGILYPRLSRGREEICDIYYNLVYSEVRLNLRDEAKLHLEDFRAYLLEKGLPPSRLWIERELGKLEEELKANP